MTRVDYTWGSMQWIEENNPALGFTLAKMTLNPGAVSDLHFHTNAIELIYVEQGTVVCTVDGDEKQLNTGAKLTIPAHKPHSLKNSSDQQAILTLVYSTHARDYFLADR